MGARRILVQRGSELRQLAVLAEAPPHNEAELQGVCAAHPELLPHEALGLTPLLSIGREVPLAPGLPDLLALDREGHIVVVEFKLLASSDRRRALAQVLDYAAALWGQSYADLERIALDFFSSGRCCDVRLRAAQTLAEAGRFFWRDTDEHDTDFDPERFRQAIDANLDAGSLDLVLVADRLPPALGRTAAYLSRVGNLSVHGVEIARFETCDMVVYVPRVAFSGSHPSDSTSAAPTARDTARTHPPTTSPAPQKDHRGDTLSGAWGLADDDMPHKDHLS